MASLFSSSTRAVPRLAGAARPGFAAVRFASSRAQPQSALTSRTSALVATAVALGTTVLYQQAYGELPFLESASANSLADEGLHPPSFPWPHSGWLETFDHQAIRRGFQVYREVCSTCHSLERLAWRNLVGVSHTVDEVKEMAAEVEYEDGPNDNGEMFQRPGKLSDYLPSPYPNEEAARAGNAGAVPPDLTLIVKARHGGADYIFSLLTGYCDPPAGISVQEGLNFNPFFPGTQIAMARVLFDGLVEYEDGTPATTSQMAKDVVTFLNFTSEPEHDDRKRAGFRAVILLSGMFALAVWLKRFKYVPWHSVPQMLTSLQIVYDPPKGHH